MAEKIPNIVLYGRFSYLHCWEPKAQLGDDGKVDPTKLRYSVSLIMDKKKDKAQIAKIEKLLDAKIAESKDVLKGKHKDSKNFKYPLRDGDEEREQDSAYKGCMFLNLNSIEAPRVVDAKVQPIINRDEIKSGDYGNVSMQFFAFNKGGGFGIGCGLSNIQKVKDGEALTARSAPEDDFEVIDVDDDDEKEDVDSLI